MASDRDKHSGPLLALALALGLMPIQACTRTGSEADESPTSAPAFAAKDLDGDYVSLADYRGTVVLLNTWATWCQPCIRELPELQKLHTQLQDRGFSVIGLNQDVRSKLPQVRRMLAHHQLSFPIWLDFESKAQVAFKLNGYPTSFLIDRQGNIRWKREGVIVENDPELGPLLEQVLAEPPG